MGKTWLLTELARRLSTNEEDRHLVGFEKSTGETPDLLLRSVIDLYRRWLSHSDYWQQAKMVWSQQKPNVRLGVATAVGTIFKEVGGKVAKPVAVAVEEAIKGLVAANQTLTTSGIRMPTLQYEQARDLVATVAQIGKRPIILVLDQWEKSPDLGLEAKTLDTFLHHLDEWPRCHVFVALRPDEPAFGTMDRLVAGRPGAAEVYRLKQMALDQTDERKRLLRFVRKTWPVATTATDDDLVNLIDGYPGVIYQWSSDYQREVMKALPDMARVAGEAQSYRFSELEALLPRLEGDQRRVIIRLALLPLGGAEIWPMIKPVVLDGLSEALIDDLKFAKLLESADPPGFGHAKRWEAAQSWLFEHRTSEVRTEGTWLVTQVASLVHSFHPDFTPHFALLWSLLETSCQLEFEDLAIALCQAAGTLFGDFSEIDDALIRGADQAKSIEFSRTAPILSMGLFNALHHAKQEDDLDRRDALLEELRALAQAHPEDAAAREQLAMGLLNTQIAARHDGDLDRRDALLEELRALAQTHPEDATAREWLAKGLINALNDAKQEDDLDRRDALLEEMRAIAQAHPKDAAAREWLAKGLFNALNDAKQEDDLDRRNALLMELRILAQTHSEDAWVQDIVSLGAIKL